MAWERIDAWTAAGYSAAWIATACGLQVRNIESALSERNSGHLRKLGATVTGRIMAADIRVGTAGHCDALVARRRLQALACHGFDTSRLQAVCGVSFVTLAAIRRGHTNTITAARHHQIANLYQQLSGSFGTSTNARHRAKTAGWVPPMGWDNIEDPTEDPSANLPTDTALDDVAIVRATHGDRVTLTKAERVAAVTRLAALGLNDQQVADRLAVTARTVLRYRQANGITSGLAA